MNDPGRPVPSHGSGPVTQATPVKVRINGELHELSHRLVTYERLVELAGLKGNPSIAIAFGNRALAGCALHRGQAVVLDDGAYIDVVHTGNA